MSAVILRQNVVYMKGTVKAGLAAYKVLASNEMGFHAKMLIVNAMTI